MMNYYHDDNYYWYYDYIYVIIMMVTTMMMIVDANLVVADAGFSPVSGQRQIMLKQQPTGCSMDGCEHSRSFAHPAKTLCSSEHSRSFARLAKSL